MAKTMCYMTNSPNVFATLTLLKILNPTHINQHKHHVRNMRADKKRTIRTIYRYIKSKLVNLKET